MELLDQIQALRGEGRVGTTLKGKYRLDGLIGGGGMASVYSATHRNSKRFAVKVLHPELSAHLDLRARFMREGYVANQVEHPGAVAVLDDGFTEDGAVFLVMELLVGETVADAADRKDGKLPVVAVIGIAYQLLDVLVAANTRGIVHRDIKPANLFLTREGQLKVLDFGVARLRDAQGATTTHTGHTLGTPAFMAPEQALGRADQIDGRTDVWAVGATMFSLLSGQLVHEASTAQEQMVFAATKPARSLAEAGAGDVPARVAEIVAKALGFRREDRWQSAAAMRAALGETYRELYGETPSLASLAAIVSEQQKLATVLGAVAPLRRHRTIRSRRPRAPTRSSPTIQSPCSCRPRRPRRSR
jgi:serine/threonine-protein kinase